MVERLTGYAPEGQKRRYVAHFVSKLTMQMASGS